HRSRRGSSGSGPWRRRGRRGRSGRARPVGRGGGVGRWAFGAPRAGGACSGGWLGDVAGEAPVGKRDRVILNPNGRAGKRRGFFLLTNPHTTGITVRPGLRDAVAFRRKSRGGPAVTGESIPDAVWTPGLV